MDEELDNGVEISAEEISSSLLYSMKKLVGIPVEDHMFDVDIIFNINDTLSTLYQLGVLKEPKTVVSSEDTYDQIFEDVSPDIVNKAKMYLGRKVKYGFDTNTLTSTHLSALQEKIKEDEWRLMAACNPENSFDE